MIVTSRVGRRLRAAKRAVGERIFASDRLRGRMQVAMIGRSGLFDEAWVRSQLPDRTRPVSIKEYVHQQWFLDDISPNPLLEPACVPETCPTREPITAYLRKQVRHVHPLFDERSYSQAHPEADNHPGGAIGHFIEHANATTQLPNQWPRTMTWGQLRATPQRSDSHQPMGTADVKVLIGPQGPSAAAIWSAVSLAQLRSGTGTWTAQLWARTPSEWRTLSGLAAVVDGLDIADEHALTPQIGGTLGVVLAQRGTTFTPRGVEVLTRELSEDIAELLAPLCLGWDHYILDHGQTLIDGLPVGNQSGRPPVDRLAAGTDVDSVGTYVVGFSTTAYKRCLANRALPPAGNWWQLPSSGETKTSGAVFTAHETNIEARADVLPLGPRSGPAVPSDAPSLRIAVRIAAPCGEIGDRWGDVPFAEDLAHAINASGNVGFVERIDQGQRGGIDNDDVAIVIRGLERMRPRDGAVNVLWIISHPELVTSAELAEFDIVFAASQQWAAATTARTGTEVRPLLQATNCDRFYYRGDITRGNDDVFVGNSRDVLRPIVADAMLAGANLKVYGHGWRRFIDSSFVAGHHLGPAEIAQVYQEARVVLSDQWQDMADSGFIVNRIFDALATGAPVISAPGVGIAELFGDRVAIYRDVPDLASLLATVPTSRARADQAEVAAWIATNHTFTQRVETILNAIRSLAERTRRPA